MRRGSRMAGVVIAVGTVVLGFALPASAAPAAAGPASTGLASTGPASTGPASTAPAAVVKAVAPRTGSTTGGATVTVTGSGFRHVSKVVFGSAAGTRLHVTSATRLTVRAPKHAAGTVDVRVVTKSGSRTTWSAKKAGDHFGYETRPPAPFVESVSGTGLGVLVTWAPPSPAQHAVSFSVTATPVAGSPATCRAKTVTAGPADTQAVAGKLCAGIAYTVQMKTRNGGGYSAASARSAPAVPLSVQVPGLPLITSVLPRSGSLQVTWAPPASDGGDPVTGYAVSATAGGSTVRVTAAASARSAVLAGLTNGTSYTVSLTAASAAGASAAATSAGAPAAVHAPSAPAGLSVVPSGTGKLVASWSPPADNGGSAVTGYRLSYQRAELSSDGQWTAVPGAPVHTVTAGKSATTVTATVFEDQKAFYLFSVTAANSAGRGPADAQQAAVTPVVTKGSRVTVLSKATVAALAGVTGSALAWTDPAPAQARALAAGQTIVAGPGSLLPEGTLRRVTDVSDSHGKLTVSTTQAALPSAFSALGVAATVNPVSGTASSPVLHASAAGGFRPAVAGVRVIQDASATGGGSITLAVDVKSGHVSVQAEASLTATIGISIGVHHGFLDVVDGASVSATARVTAALAGTVAVTGKWSRQIGEIDGAPVDIQVGPVPVVIEPRVPVFLTASGSTGLGIEVGDTIGGSVAWSSGDPTHLDTASLSGSPSLTGRVVAGVTSTGDLSLGLRVQPQVDIFGAAGPNVEGDLDLDAGVDYSPAPGDPFLTIGPQLQLKAGVDLDLLGQHADLEATIGTQAFAAFRIAKPPAASYTITPAGASVAPGGTLALSAARSDGASEPVTWGLLGAVRSDSISRTGTLHVSGPAGRTLTVTVSDASGAAGQATVTVGSAFGAPSGVTAKQHATDSGADISWTAPPATGGSALAGYTILTEPPTGAHTVAGTATSLTLPSLSPGSYVVSVYATNKAGEVSPPGTALLTISGAVLDFDHSQSVDVSDEDPVAISCPTTAFCLSVGYFGEVGVYRSGRWATGPAVPDAIAPSVSCVSPAWCLAVYIAEDSGPAARAVVFNGTRWSAPVTIDSASGDGVTSLSCASTTFCVALDYHGRAIRYTGSGWGKPQALLPQGGSFASVSCVSGPACLVASGGSWARYQDGKWSSPSHIGRSVAVASVSCASADRCVGVGADSSGKTSDGESTTFNGSSWSAPAVINTGGGLSGDGSVQSLRTVSCRSASFCLAADSAGEGYTFNGKAWRSAGRIYPEVITGGSPFVVSCVSASWCAVAGDVSNADVAATWTPSGWSPVADFGALISGLSCPSVTFCVAAGSDTLDQELSVASVFSGSTWSTPVIVDPDGGQPEVSCPSAGFCVMIAWNGDVATYSGGKWSAPRQVDSEDGFLAVSCASASFCMAVDQAGSAYSYNGSGWSGPAQVETFTSPGSYGGLTSVSCPVAGICVAGDVYGRTVTYSGGAWSATPVAVPGLVYIDSVDCTSASFGVAAGSATSAMSAPAAAELDGTTWSALSLPDVPSNDYYGGVSCTSRSFCALSDTEDAPLADANGDWSPSFIAQPIFTDGISCTGPDWCAAAGWTSTMLWSGNP